MKIKQLLTTTVLAATLAASSMAYAQDAATSAGATSGHKPGWMEMRKEHRDSTLSQLPPEKAKLYKDAMKAARDKNKSDFEHIKKLREEQDALLTADKFDKDAYLAKNAEIEKAYTSMHANTTDAFVSVASQFTPDERKVLAKLHEHKKHDGKGVDGQPSQ